MTHYERAAACRARAVASGLPYVPLGALRLGCSNCRQGDMALHPELGTVYCAACPVVKRAPEHMRVRLMEGSKADG